VSGEGSNGREVLGFVVCVLRCMSKPVSKEEILVLVLFVTTLSFSLVLSGFIGVNGTSTNPLYCGSSVFKFPYEGRDIDSKKEDEESLSKRLMVGISLPGEPGT
jgi:hypothetical protein